jgi:hypothetical protein
MTDDTDAALLARAMELAAELVAADQDSIDFDHAKTWFHSLSNQRQYEVAEFLEPFLAQGDWEGANRQLIVEWRKALAGYKTEQTRGAAAHEVRAGDPPQA